MVSFIALYAGPTVSDAQLVSVSAEPDLVAVVAEHLLHKLDQPLDPVAARLVTGRRAALRLIQREAHDAGD